MRLFLPPPRVCAGRVAAKGGQVGSLRVTDFYRFVMPSRENILGKTSHAERPHLSR